MEYDKIEIIPIIKLGSLVTKHNNNFNYDKILKNFTFKKTMQCKIFVYNDLYMIMDKNKSSYKVKYINSKLFDNVLYIKQKYENIPIENFPFIDKYDSVIIRNITQYNDGINLITDKYLNNNETLSFITVENDEKLEIILKLIKETS